ncbi:MAG: transposase, partial [Cyanobacteria bacterium J06649_11]
IKLLTSYFLLPRSGTSNLTWEQWLLIEDLFPEPLSGGRPRTVAIYAVVNAILYVLCQSLCSQYCSDKEGIREGKLRRQGAEGKGRTVGT